MPTLRTMDKLTFSNISSDNFEEEAQRKAGRKRPRVRNPLSCYQCRSRKIRCDRELPCKPCTGRGAGGRCTYNQSKASSRTSISPKAQELAADEPRQQRTPEEVPAVSFQESDQTSSTLSPPIVSPTEQPHETQSVPASTQMKPSSGQDVQDVQDASRHAPRLPFTGHILQRVNRKTRLVGVSYWMAPCNGMTVVKELVARSRGFQDSMKELAVLKERLRRLNTVTASPPSLSAEHSCSGTGTTATVLLAVLPDRSSCKQWIGRFFQSYGRIYSIVDTATLATDLHQAFSWPPNAKHGYATALDTVYLLRILAVIALGMQVSEPHRLRGRNLGLLVEDFIHKASRVHKPCIGSVQVLLLLFLLRTVMASDTDGDYDSMALFGLLNHLVSSMGLQRDPALFGIVSPYHSEQRKRLWACYLRLSLGYCVRTGTQLLLRLEDVDCPLPTPSVLKTKTTSTNAMPDKSIQECANEWAFGENEAENDARFNYISARLANMMAPIHQTLCSAKPLVTAEQQKTLLSGFASLTSEIPPSLQSGTSITDPIVKLQRALIFVEMHSYVLIVSLSSILQSSTDQLMTSGDFATQRPQLLETWDDTTSILNHFESVCNRPASPVDFTDMADRDASIMAHHLMWADAGRAALTGCLILGRLRRHDMDKAMPFSGYPQQQHSTVIFQQVLAQFLSMLLDLWRSRSHLGPVTAKSSMIVAVAVAVTDCLYTDYDGILDKGVAAANQLIVDMKTSLDRRLDSVGTGSGIRDSGISMNDAASAAATAHQTSTSALSPLENQSQTVIAAMVPLPIIASTVPCAPVNVPGPALAHLAQEQHALLLSSTQLWSAPPIQFDNQAFPPQKATDLSVANSSAGLQTTTPDFQSHNASIYGQNLFPDISFPYAMAGNFDTGCTLMGDLDSTLFDFSGDTVMNMLSS